MKAFFICIMALLAMDAASSFSSPSSSSSSSSSPWKNMLDTFSSSFNNNNNNAPKQQNQQQAIQLRNELKNKLYIECRQSYGINNPEIRTRMEGIIRELESVNPTRDASLSPLLKRKWVVEWTSEKEINFFLEKGISNEIVQTLSGDILENYIPFVNGGGFGVTGRISPADNDADADAEMRSDTDEENDSMRRTNFKFLNAKLTLGWGWEFNFPPVGRGWFDTVYLDEDLRIDTNSRDDILICRAE